ncbi:MAG: hypothetical protein RSB96_04185 [Oscillospiraceae bacterium]
MTNQLFYNQILKNTLTAFISSGRFPHTIVIEGATGTGKKHFSSIFAQVALCSNTEKPCGQCTNCKKVEKFIHPDVLYLKADISSHCIHHLQTIKQKKETVGIDVVRWVKQTAYIKPNEAAKKIYVFTDAHNMTIQAQNALLKLIEEPPLFTLFLLLVPSKNKLLPTILSRATILQMEKTSISQCIQALSHIVPDQTEEAYEMASSKADGIIGIALKQLNDATYGQLVSDALEIIKSIAFHDEYHALRILVKYDNKKSLLCLCEELTNIYGLLAVMGYEKNAPYLKEVREKISPLQSIQIVDIIEECTNKIQHNVSPILMGTWLCAMIKSISF